jgi:hypothetical protein
MIYVSLNFQKPRSTYSLVTTIKLNVILLFYTLQLYCLKKRYLIQRPITTQCPDLKVNVANVASTSQFRVPGFLYRCACKSLGRPGRKEATATEDFDFHISYL